MGDHTDEERGVWLCFSGGNALGSYHAGAYEALHDAGITPQRIAGCSIGAIIGAIVAGNKPEDRIAKLNAFWHAASEKLSTANLFDNDTAKITSALGTLFHGRPGLFLPRFGLLWRWLIGLSSPSLFERSGLRQTLGDYVDFSRLNSGEIRFIVNAVDVETGEDVVFDSAEVQIGVDHLLATTAFPVLYPPEEVGGRMLVDGGVSANLPLMPLFRSPAPGPVACIAFDLATPRGTAPKSLDQALERAQDLVLSKQSQHAIALTRANLETPPASPGRPEQPAVMVLHVAYQAQGEVGGKMLEYSARSIQKRWDAGRRDGQFACKWLSTVKEDAERCGVDTLKVGGSEREQEQALFGHID